MVHFHLNAERHQQTPTPREPQTFENEPLSGDTIDFDCLSLEVWGFK